MRTRYDQSQDITFFLTSEETEEILKGPTPNFLDIHKCSQKLDSRGQHYLFLWTISAEGSFYLGYSLEEEMFEGGLDMEGMGKILMPNEERECWMVNLSTRGVEHLKRNWPQSLRYDGTHKLFILQEEA